MVLRTADLCDEHGDAVIVCEPVFGDYGGRTDFHGEIVTVATFEDNSKVREVLEWDGKGKVLVIDGRASCRRALVGGNVVQFAASRGWAGIVINGCLRDAHEIAEADLGVKAIAICPRRPKKENYGEINVPVSFAGATFRPGEYLYADGDGIVLSKAPLHA